MVEERYITIGETTYTVALSDETDSLLASYEAGKAVIGIWDPEKPQVSLFPAKYVVERGADADDRLL